MRRSRSGAAAEQADVDLTPMLDVVFILLIFFIVSASFAREIGLDLAARPGTAPVRAVDDLENILIQVTSDETIFVDRRAVALDSVRAQIERLRAERPQGSVVIAAAGRARNGVLVELMDQARLAGVDRIALADELP
jgi:biopolymer transport protein ExbD